MDSIPPFVIVIFLVIVGFIVFTYLRDRKIKNELRQRGVTVTAHVTDRYHDVQTSTDSDNNTTTTDYYYISYQYLANGNPYSRRDSVSHNTYEILREGQAVEVVYLPDNPAEARLASLL